MAQIAIENNLKESLKLLKTSHAKVTGDFLRSLADTFNCEWAVYWVVDSQAKKLSCCMSWTSPTMDLNILLEDTKNRHLTVNEGIPGQVWRVKKVVLSDDLEMEMALPRSIYAHEAGLRHGIWIPVLHNGQNMYGVIELLGRQLPSLSNSLVAKIAQFGFEIGAMKKDHSL